MPCPAKELGNKAVDISTVSVAPVFQTGRFYLKDSEDGFQIMQS
jgi:hypothetical protein